MKRLEQAEREFRAAVELAQEKPVAHFNLGAVLLKRGADSEGTAVLERYLELEGEGGQARQARRLIENPRRARENYAPEFTAHLMAGETLSSEELLGKVVLLDFWATWCPPCHDAVPDLKRLHQSFAEEPFVLLSISVDHDEHAWRSFVEERGLDWPQTRDEKGAILRLFFPGQRFSIPTYIVIDAEGIVRSISGPERGRLMFNLRRMIRKHLDEAFR